MKRKLKILMITPLAAGAIIAADATRSDAFLVKTMKGLWNQTTEIVSSGLNYYVGNYMTDLTNHYVPKGLEKIAGALGLPDPGGMFEDIRAESKKNKTENNDIAAGDFEENDVASGTGQSMGEAVLSEEGQQVQKQASEASLSLSKSSAEVAEKCQSSNITQEVMKCVTSQLGTNANLSNIQISQQQQILQQLAAGNIANSKVLERENQKARAEQADIENSSDEAITQAQVIAAWGDSLSEQ